MIWSVQSDDLVGGWIVTTYPHPISKHDFRKDGNPEKRGIIAAECSDNKYAVLIAKLLNFVEDVRKGE